MPPTTDGRVLRSSPQTKRAVHSICEAALRRILHILSIIGEFHMLEYITTKSACAGSILFGSNAYKHSTVSYNCEQGRFPFIPNETIKVDNGDTIL